MKKPDEYTVDEKTLKWLAAIQPVGKKRTYKPKKVPKLPKNSNRELMFSEGDLTDITIERKYFAAVNQIPQIGVQRPLVQRRLNKFLSYAENQQAYSHYSGRSVVAIRYPTGQMFLIDGNTRIAQWHNERVKAIESGTPSKIDLPEYINLFIFNVKNIKEAEQLYYTFDNKNATESVPDKLGGAVDSIGRKWNNPVLISNRFKTGLKQVAKLIKNKPITDICEERGLLKLFINQLDFINDYAKFQTNLLGFEVVAYMAIMLYKHKNDAAECDNILNFFNSVGCGYNDLSKNGKKNAVTLMMREYDKSNSRRVFPHKSAFRQEMFGLWVQYYEDFKIDKMRAVPIKCDPNKETDRAKLRAIFSSYFDDVSE